MPGKPINIVGTHLKQREIDRCSEPKRNNSREKDESDSIAGNIGSLNEMPRFFPVLVTTNDRLPSDRTLVYPY
jgi:hypothetical protein